MKSVIVVRTDWQNPENSVFSVGVGLAVDIAYTSFVRLMIIRIRFLFNF